MVQEIIAYIIIAVTVGVVIYSLFFKKNRGCSCGSSSGSGCSDCPYCSGETDDPSKCVKCSKPKLE